MPETTRPCTGISPSTTPRPPLETKSTPAAPREPATDAHHNTPAPTRKVLGAGGPLPLCYHMKDDKIAVVENEAERVRLIFRRYLELGGVNALVRNLRKQDIRTKSRLLATCATRGGVPFGRGSLFYLLRNRFYVVEVKYKD